MKKYKIKFKSGPDNYIKYINAENIKEAMTKFYLNINCYDIISVELMPMNEKER